MIYAASTISLEDGRKLLDLMRQHVLSFKLLQPVLELWLSRAEFVTETVLQHAAQVSDQPGRSDYLPQTLNRNTLPHTVATPFAIAPPFSSDAEQRIRKQFVRFAGGRGNKKKTEG